MEGGAAEPSNQVNSRNDPSQLPAVQHEHRGVPREDGREEIRREVFTDLGVRLFLDVTNMYPPSVGLGERPQKGRFGDRSRDASRFHHGKLRESALLHHPGRLAHKGDSIDRGHFPLHHVPTPEGRGGVGLEPLEVGQDPLDQLIRRSDPTSLDPRDGGIAPAHRLRELSERETEREASFADLCKRVHREGYPLPLLQSCPTTGATVGAGPGSAGPPAGETYKSAWATLLSEAL